MSGAPSTSPDQPLALLVDAALDDCVQLGTVLRRENFAVITAGTLLEAKMLLDAFTPTVVVFDRTLPDGDGLVLAQLLHAREHPPFLVVLTDRIEEADRLLGFEAGVDDYVAKPFSPQEVAFRLRAMLRRAAVHRPAASTPAPADVPDHATNALRVGALAVDPDTYEAQVDEQHVELTPVEFQILLALVRNAKLVLTRDQLVEHVWGATWNGDGHALDVHVSNLRRKLSKLPRDQTYIRSVRGVGYRLGPCEPVREPALAGG